MSKKTKRGNSGKGVLITFGILLFVLMVILTFIIYFFDPFKDFKGLNKSEFLAKATCDNNCQKVLLPIPNNTLTEDLGSDITDCLSSKKQQFPLIIKNEYVISVLGKINNTYIESNISFDGVIAPLQRGDWSSLGNEYVYINKSSSNEFIMTAPTNFLKSNNPEDLKDDIGFILGRYCKKFNKMVSKDRPSWFFLSQ
ncbi:hypothetical protein [Pseudocitrobacter corydidari]|uniref:Uncharacterized protein n=2 Tax=Enterobacteriaceae TaxID=543 RepID=A0ABY3SC80_9ENTR|nr:hypothetical protein [Pseudocitrobacter corydidari]UGS43813.1 hypothetical protein G163CM_45960 [Pseudocitrobacter corydidari]HCL8467675.1 hypothetical protein [Escherichia coli]